MIKFPKIGMRNIKTSLAVFICLLLFKLINRDNSIFACIAAVICMQNTVDDSFNKGIERTIGTILGGVAGVVVYYILNELFVHDVSIFIIPIGIIILIELCLILNVKQSIVICIVVYLTVLISPSIKGNHVMYTIMRVIDTTIGIVVAILINKYIVMPKKLRDLLLRHDNLTFDSNDLDISNEKENTNEITNNSSGNIEDDENNINNFK